MNMPKRYTRTNSTMFAAHYDDGRTAYFVMEKRSAGDDHLAGPAARERQTRGELPEGQIVRVKRVR